MRTIGRDEIYERGKFFLALICLFCLTLTYSAEVLLNLPVSIIYFSFLRPTFFVVPWPQSLANCWFSHDITKIQTKKLSTLPRFYFHDALEQLKTNFHTNFCFKRVLGFVIEHAWISKLCVTRHLHDGQESCHVGKKNDLFQEILLSKQFMY